MEKIRIIIDDNSGGVLTTSARLNEVFSNKGYDSSLINLYQTSQKKIFYRVLRGVHLLRGDKKNFYILMHFLPISIGLLLRLFGFDRIINVVHTDLCKYYQDANLLKKIIIYLIFYLIRHKPLVFVSKEAMLSGRDFFRLKNVFYIYNIHEMPAEIDVSSQMNDESKIRLGIVSRLDKLKNIDLVVSIVQRIRESSQNVSLLIYGNGPEYENLDLYVKLLGCKEFVEFCGFSDNKSMIFDSIDAVISLSSIEGLPTVILESIAYRKPILHTDCHSGPRELMCPDSDILNKTSSFEKTEIGYLVKPVIDREPYSLELSEYEQEYLDYITSFIEEVMNNNFSMRYDASRFSADTVFGEWQKILRQYEGI